MPDSNKSTGVAYGRKRAKTACSTCRSLKRKCSGTYPCSMCVQYEYECKFEGKPKHALRSPPSEDEISRNKLRGSHTPSSSMANSVSEQQDKHLELIKASASLNFPQALFTQLLDGRAPNIGPYAWNLGIGFFSGQPQPQITRSIQDLMDRKDVNRFVNRYFESFHLMYSFLDEQEFRLRLASRIKESKPYADVFDAVLCGTIALGMTFSGPSSLQQKLNLVAHAHSLLSVDAMFPNPSIDDVEAWLLRAFFMRIAGSHHAAWIASCTALQVAEAVNVHLEPDYDDDQADRKRRLFWIGRALNTWISLDTGRSSFEVRGATCYPPGPATPDRPLGYRNFVDVVTLYEISMYLDPQVDENPDLEDLLHKIISVEPKHDELILSQANLVLCVFRRFRLARPNVSPELVDIMVDFLNTSLNSATKLIEAKQPWWHVVSVPFQFVCILISLDTPKSLSQIGQGIRTLQQAAAQFNTPVTQGVVNIVGHLVRLSYEKKQEESAHLFGTLNNQSPGSNYRSIAMMPEKYTGPTAFDDQQDMDCIEDIASVPPFFDSDLSWSDFLEGGVPEF